MRQMTPRQGGRAARLRIRILAAVAALALGVLVAASTAFSGGGGTAPANSAAPTISGDAVEGATLTAASGTWTGTTPISYAYRWARCNSSGASCNDIGSATSGTYTLAQADVGKTLRVTVTATNSAGSSEATSAATGVVAAGAAPKNTIRPTISGTTTEGQTLTADKGSWTGTTPITYTYEWQRCDDKGNNCADVSGATSTTYVLTSADVGKTVRVGVTATNSQGSGDEESQVTGVVAAATAPGPAGAIKLSDGKTSIPAASVSLPERLIISGVAFNPSIVRSREPFAARFRVTDTRGNVVRDVLVYAIGLPYGRVAGVPEARTGMDGWATIAIQPTAKLPLARGSALVFFVRARKDGDSLLAGVSTRRLVQVLLGPAAG